MDLESEGQSMSTSQLDLFAPAKAGYGTDRGRRSYHQARPIPGPALPAAAEIKAGERKARQQEDAILAFYRANPGAWSPSQVWEGTNRRYPWARFLLTSCRRGITNLTSRGLLRMTSERRPGPFGAMEHLWTLEGEI